MMAPIYSKPQERHLVLSRIAASLRDVREKDSRKDVPLAWEYGQSTKAEHEDVKHRIRLFMKRCADYKASVAWIESEKRLPEAVAFAVGKLSLQSLVVPPELDAQWLTRLDLDALVLAQDKPPLSKEDLDGIDGVLTASAVGIAETGTIALDHSANQGRRLLSLLPRSHICVVRARDIVDGVPQAIQRLKPSLAAGNPMTWISGPSATVDIEFSRVEGVHGPHQLFVLVVEEG